MNLVIVRTYPINYEHEITLVIPEAEFESHLVLSIHDAGVVFLGWRLFEVEEQY